MAGRSSVVEQPFRLPILDSLLSYIGRGRGGAIVAIGAIVVAGGISSGIFVPNRPAIPPSGGGSITCNQSSTSAADFTNDLAAASSGQTICLTSAVNYGTFSGTTKNLTIVSQSGSGTPSPVNNTLILNMGSGDNGIVTIDGGRKRWDSTVGLNIPTAQFGTGAANLTLKDFEIDGTGGSGRRWIFDPSPVNSNIVIEHFHAHDVTAGEALFFIEPPSGAAGQNTGITIRNGLFRHLSNDGIKLGGDFVIQILNNKFMDFHESNGSDGNHTDQIQPLLTKHAIIKGNWFKDGDQCLFGDDGTGALTIAHNVIDNCGAWSVYIGGDGPVGSTVSFNTITDRTFDFAGGYTCGNNSIDDPFGGVMDRSVPDLQNNIFQEIILTQGALDCQPVANHHNMLLPGQPTAGVGGSNFTGTQTYVGGSDLSTFDTFSDYCLTPASDGYTSATDGGQVGACGGDYNGSNYGPPTGEGY